MCVESLNVLLHGTIYCNTYSDILIVCNSLIYCDVKRLVCFSENRVQRFKVQYT